MLSPPVPPEEIVALLRWYADMGVDTAIGDHPVDRFAESAPATPAPKQQSVPFSRAAPPEPATPPPAPRAATPAPSLLTTAPDAVVLEAREQARSAQSLEELRAILERFDGCALRATATRLVFADGAADARVMFVGEAPG